MKQHHKRPLIASVLALSATVGCSDAIAQTVEITEVPRCGVGGPSETAMIAGKTSGAQHGDNRIVLFAQSDKWYVQPYVAAPLTAISHDGTWRAYTHLGTQYAALLVKRSYEPPSATFVLPRAGAEVFDVDVGTCGDR